MQLGRAKMCSSMRNAIFSAPFSRSPNNAPCPLENRASKCIVSANTGLQTSSGGSNSSTCSTTQR